MGPLDSAKKDVPCPLCDGYEWRLYVWAPSHYGPEKWRVTQCTRCGMIFTNPQGTGYEENVSRRGVLDRHFAPAMLERARRVARFQLAILSELSPGPRVLDFGSGAGVFVDEAIRRGWDATGLDLNRGLSQAANRRWGFNALQGGSLEECISQGVQPFDAIISNQVFEHIRRPVETGKTLVSLLRQRGVIYIDVPNAGQVTELLHRGRTLDPTAHFNHFTIASLRHLVRRIGCRPIFCSAGPSLVRLYHRMGLKRLCYSMGRLSRRLLPPVGSGVCAVGRRP